MKQLIKTALSILLVIVMFFQYLPIKSSAISWTDYVTVKEDVPIWTDCSSNSTKIRTISKGVRLVLVSSTTNSAGNLWYKFKDNTWVFSGNIEKASIICTTAKADVPIWSAASSSSNKVRTISKSGTQLEIISSTTNDKGNLWYKLKDNTWVYSGNVNKHNHQGVMCGTNPATYESINATQHKKYQVINDDICSCGAYVGMGTLSTKTENHTFNSSSTCSLCGYKKAHEHQTVMCGNPTTTYEQKDSTTHIKVVKAGDELCSCGYVVVQGKTTRTSENHSFNSSNVCTKCGYKKPHEHQAVMCGNPTTTYEQKDSTTHIKVVKAGDELCSCGYVVAQGKTTRTSENHSFNSSNVCTKCGYKKTHEHKGYLYGLASNSYEEYDSKYHTRIYTSGGVTCSCGYVIEAPKVTKTLEEHNFNSSGTCTVCGYIKSHVHAYTLLIYSEEHPHYVYRQCSCGKRINDSNAKKKDYPNCEYCHFASEEKATYTKFKTNCNNVNVRTWCTGDSPTDHVIKKKGTNVTIEYLVLNLKGNLWGRTNDNLYIYMGNLEAVEKDNYDKLLADKYGCKSTSFSKGKLISKSYAYSSDKVYHTETLVYEKICNVCGKPYLGNHSSSTIDSNAYTITETKKVKHSFNAIGECTKCKYSEARAAEKEQKLNEIQTDLAAIGLIPGADLADVVDLIICVARGDYGGAALSIASIVPIIDNATGAAKIAKYSENIADLLKTIDNSDEVIAAIRKAKTTDEIVEILKLVESSGDFKDILKVVDDSDDIIKIINKSYNPKEAAKKGVKSARDLLLDSVENTKLRNYIDNSAFRKESTFGNGGVADAIRYELETGELIGGKSHMGEKYINSVNCLKKILDDPNLSKTDRNIAQALLKDIQNAYNGIK